MAETVRKEAGAVCQLSISLSGEGGQAGRGWKDQGVIREEMIIGHIGDGSRVKTIIGSEIRFCATSGRMGVGKGIDSAVECDPGLDVGGIIQLSLAFYKIADQVSYHDIRDVEG